MVSLPPKDNGVGLETRVLLAECRSPAFSSYTEADAKTCMEWMDLVIWNRVRHPRAFGAKTDSSLHDIITQAGQFAGFEKYPDYAVSVAQRIQDMVNIANAKKDGRSAKFTTHIELAIAIARTDKTVSEPSRGLLASWRTAGSSSPGSNFTLHKAVLGNDFYFIAPPP